MAEKVNSIGNILDIFVKNFKPSNNLVKPNNEILKKANESVLPKEFITLYEKYGFGNYGNGIIKIINPFEYDDNLYKWLGRKDENKLPVIMTAFGDLIYYRKLTDEDEDYCFLDVHYKNIKMIEFHFENLVNDYLLNEETQNTDLRKKLFLEALDQEGELEINEIYMFVPALALGGGENLKYIKKGDALIHQDLLLQI